MASVLSYAGLAWLPLNVTLPKAFIQEHYCGETMSNIHGKDYQSFLRKLKRARLDAELSQEEVGAILKRPQSFVSRSESGESRVDVVDLQLFAAIYRKPITYFF